jgi:hypothetical protein
VPQVDVQPLDLLDQEQDRAAGSAYLVAAVVEQTLAPRPQGLDLVCVEPLRRQSLLLAGRTVGRWRRATRQRCFIRFAYL